MAPKEFLAQQPDLFKPIQSINAVLILICLGSSSVVPGVGVLWFVGLCSLFVSTTATVLFMLNSDKGLSGVTISGAFIPWGVIEFVYSSILTLLCGVGFWLAFGFASHVSADGHSAGYIFTGIFLVAQVACYAIPVMIIYDRSRAGTEHEPIADVHSFGVASDGSEQRYQTIQPERAFV
uniref:MARVEL domain-containing protein n=1 Tax=Globodera rostochiensis TaxID=31243 RepID=A0A914HEP2_GLORO